MNVTGGLECFRCSTIDWERLRPELDERVLVCAIEESVTELKQSSCPTCHVLGTALEARQLARHLPDAREFGLCLVYSRGVFSLRRKTSHIRTSFTLSLKLCEKDDPYLTDLQAEAFNRVDFESLKYWMANCKMHEKCNIPPKSGMNDLKVIDCHHRRVIPAPEKCIFVALSYVWGPSMLEDCTQFPNLPSRLPRTVEDSIEATTLLGFQFLWVDRYVSST